MKTTPRYPERQLQAERNVHIDFSQPTDRTHPEGAVLHRARIEHTTWVVAGVVILPSSRSARTTSALKMLKPIVTCDRFTVEQF